MAENELEINDMAEGDEKQDQPKNKGGRPRKPKPDISVTELDIRHDIFHVSNADPDKSYFHARDDAMRIRQLEQQGYHVCDGEEVLGSSYVAISNKGGSGPINNPGHILMWTPKENKERLESIKDARLKRHEQDVKDKTDAVKAIIERKGLGRMRAKLKSDMEFEI